MKSHPLLYSVILFLVMYFRITKSFSDAEFIVAILIADIAYDVDCILCELRNKGKYDD